MSLAYFKLWKARSWGVDDPPNVIRPFKIENEWNGSGATGEGSEFTLMKHRQTKHLNKRRYAGNKGVREEGRKKKIQKNRKEQQETFNHVFYIRKLWTRFESRKVIPADFVDWKRINRIKIVYFKANICLCFFNSYSTSPPPSSFSVLFFSLTSFISLGDNFSKCPV